MYLYVMMCKTNNEYKIYNIYNIYTLNLHVKIGMYLFNLLNNIIFNWNTLFIVFWQIYFLIDLLPVQEIQRTLICFSGFTMICLYKTCVCVCI